jgi:hypothetical protein
VSAIYAPTVRRSALAATGGFDPELRSGEDWDAWLKLARRGRLLHAPRVALRYRLRDTGLSSDYLESYRCARRVAERHLRDVPVARRARVRRGVERFFRRAYPPRLVRQASELGWRGDWTAAREVWRAAAALEPRLLLRPRALANVAWAWLPVLREPPWRALHRAAAPRAAAPPLV